MNGFGDKQKWYFRVREVCERTGLSKPKVFQLLRDGKLKGYKLDGVTLITADSVERYLATAVPWAPTSAPVV